MVHVIRSTGAVVLLALVVHFAISFIPWLGVFQRVYKHAPGKCRRLEGIDQGSEDIVGLPNGLAFISSGVQVRTTGPYADRVGRIYLFDFKHPDVAPVELAIKSDTNDYKLVSPIGISAWTDPTTGRIYLYVIVYQDVAIDKFQFDSVTKTLTFIRRIPHDRHFRVLNNLVVVGEDQFYFTNTNYAQNWDWLEALLGLRSGSFGFYNGSESTLIDWIPFADGVGISPDGMYLYVASIGDEEIRIYERHANNSATFLDAVKVWTKPDNINVDPTTGDLWFAGFPVCYAGLRLLDEPSYRTPCHVIRMKMSHGKAIEIEEIYSDDGTQLSGATAALRYGQGLLIGSLNTHALYCELR